MNTKIKNIIKTTLVVLAAVLITNTTVNAIGTLTPSGTPGEDTQYSLIDIYNKITNINATLSIKTAPDFDSIVASFRTLSEIWGLLETAEDVVIPENIKDGVTIFGVEGDLEEGGEQGLPKTGQTTVYTENDDGDSGVGIELSYTDNGNETITDNATGLVWQKSGSHNPAGWPEAISYCNNLSLAGGGWRLPNIKELQSIIDFGRVSPATNPLFTSTQNGFYWSSTTVMGNQNNAWILYFLNGDLSVYFK